LRRHPWRRRSLIAAGALLAAAVTVLGVLAGTYQPLEFGGQWSTAGGSNYFPGLPSGTGLRSVNTFGERTGQVYVPPQGGVFTVMESIYDNGPKPVTIEAVSILSPQNQAYAAEGESPWPVVPAGPVHWTLQIQGLPHAGPAAVPRSPESRSVPARDCSSGSRCGCAAVVSATPRVGGPASTPSTSRSVHPLGDGPVPAAPDHARAAAGRHPAIPRPGLPARRHEITSRNKGQPVIA
jgi:hypothetical protein